MTGVFSSNTIGLVFFLAIISFAAAYYFGSEKKHMEFLSKRIADGEDENNGARAQRLKEQLRDLGAVMTYNKLIQISYLSMFISFIGSCFIGFPPVGLVLAGICYKIPEMYISQKKAKLDAEFEEQLPECLESLTAILLAGQTKEQGFKVLAESASFPACHEFARISSDINTGASLEDTLHALYKRHPNNDIKLLCTGLIVSAKVGPEVAINTLRTVYETIRNRDSQKKSAKSAIMQGKITSIVMACAPLIGAAILPMTEYGAPLINTFAGNMILVSALVLDAVGYVISKKITNTSSIVNY